MTVAIAPEFAPRARRDEPLSRHTSWHVGRPGRSVLQAARPRGSGGVPAQRCRRRCRCTGSGSAAICWCATAASAASSSATHGTLDAPRAPRTRRRCTRRGRRRLRAHRAPVHQVGPGSGGVFRRHSRHARRRAGDERRRLRRGDLARTCSSVETIDRTRPARARARRREYRVSYRQVAGAGAAEEWFMSAELSFEQRPQRACGRAARSCSSGARRRSRSGSGAAARCSRTRPGITPRA